MLCPVRNHKSDNLPNDAKHLKLCGKTEISLVVSHQTTENITNLVNPIKKSSYEKQEIFFTSNTSKDESYIHNVLKLLILDSNTKSVT